MAAGSIGVELQLMPMLLGFLTYKGAVIARGAADLFADLTAPAAGAPAPLPRVTLPATLFVKPLRRTSLVHAVSVCLLCLCGALLCCRVWVRVAPAVPLALPASLQFRSHSSGDRSLQHRDGCSALVHSGGCGMQRAHCTSAVSDKLWWCSSGDHCPMLST